MPTERRGVRYQVQDPLVQQPGTKKHHVRCKFEQNCHCGLEWYKDFPEVTSRNLLLISLHKK
jgi:hypothetical protein